MVSDVDRTIRNMKLGKSPGVDGVEVEHLIYSHPILVILLTLLFNALLRHSYVPTDFTLGIIIPILKNNDSDSTCASNYRGIL